MAAPVSKLEFLRPEQRVNQIAHDDKRHDQSDQIFKSHINPLQMVATPHIQPRDHEEKNRNDDEYKVSHMNAPKTVDLKVQLSNGHATGPQPTSDEEETAAMKNHLIFQACSRSRPIKQS